MDIITLLAELGGIDDWTKKHLEERRKQFISEANERLLRTGHRIPVHMWGELENLLYHYEHEFAFYVSDAVSKHKQQIMKVEKFDQRGKKLSKSRDKSAFTEAMEYLVRRCRDENRNSLLEPGKIDDFLKFVSKSVKDGKAQDQYAAERIESVSVGAVDCFSMQNGQKIKRSTVQDKLSKLRRNIS